MRKRVIALFAVLLVSTVASAGIITISATNDKNSTYKIVHIMKEQQKILP